MHCPCGIHLPFSAGPENRDALLRWGTDVSNIIPFRTRLSTIGERTLGHAQLNLWHNLLLLAAIVLAIYNLSAAVHVVKHAPIYAIHG